MGGEEVADQRVGRRRVAGLADADAHAHQQEAPEVPGQAVHRGQPAPHRQAPAHDLPARAGIGHASQGNAGDGVDQGEGGADQAQLEVAQAPLVAYRFDDDGRDGPVEEVEQVGQEQQEEHAPGIGRLRGLLHESVSFLF
ncbi:hypothetical protein FQZ97_632400 [compost metagenome]